MKKQISILHRMVGSLLALTMLCALPLVTSCDENEEPTVTPPVEKVLPADAGAISTTKLEDGTFKLSVAAIEHAETYRWYKDGESVQDTEERTYHATESGKYKVAGVNKDGEGKASAEVTVTIEQDPGQDDPVVEEFSATVEATKLSFNDIQITVEVKGTEGYFAGNVMKEAFAAEDILSYVETMKPTTEMNYTGSLVDFPEQSGEVILPGVSYLVWIVNQKSEGAYTTEDILTFEFTAPELTSGGSVNVEVIKPFIYQTEVQVDLAADGAYCIYHTYLLEKDYASYGDSTAKIEMLLASATQTEGATATAYSATSVSLEPETNVWLLAVAVDQEGRYGALLEQMYTTLPEPKNFTLTIDEEGCSYTENSVTIRWNITDGEPVKTVYFFAPADDNFWLSNLGSDFNRAIEFISVNPGNSAFVSTTETMVEFTGLTESKRYVFVAVAFDADEMPSMGDGLYVTPQSNVVYISRYLEDGTENPKWTATCPTIHVADYCFQKGQMTRLFWTVDFVEGTTAYTTAIKTDYVKENYSSTKAWTMDIVANPDQMYSVYYWVPDNPNIPDPNHEQGGGRSVSAEVTLVPDNTTIFYHPMGTPDMKIYVTWKDAEGNLYEPVTEDVPVLSVE